VPEGSHFCIFYQTRRDLLDTVVGLVKTGLEQNEFCLWVVDDYEFISTKAAAKALAKAFPPVKNFIRNGNVQILTHKQLFETESRIDPTVALTRVRRKMSDALANGLHRLRWIGGPSWVRWSLRPHRFREFELEVDVLLAGQPIIAACTFPMSLSTADEILDAARTHQFAVTARNGSWKRVGIAEIDAAAQEASRRGPDLEQLSFRQREILQHIAEGLNTKQIAALLGISVKTVEAHRLQLMRRLKIDNVPGLVRFAIRTGLVSIAA